MLASRGENASRPLWAAKLSSGPQKGEVSMPRDRLCLGFYIPLGFAAGALDRHMKGKSSGTKRDTRAFE